MSKGKIITEESGIQKEWYERADKITLAELPEFMRELSEDYHHDYGTICHAIAASGIAAMKSFNRGPSGGITGFQAGAIIWQVIEGWGAFDKGPKRIVSYHNMLYPQYHDSFRCISKDTWEWLQEEAAKLMKEAPAEMNAAGPVYRHWQSIVAGQVPFGYTVETK